MIMWDWSFVEEESKFIWEEKDSDKKNSSDKEDMNEKTFEFYTTRLKDPDTKREVMQIEVWKEGEETTTIVTSMRNLYDALLSLVDYGVIFTDDNARMKLKRKIEQVYNRIPSEDIKFFENTKRSKFDSFIEAIVEYINSDQEETKDKEKKEKNSKTERKPFYPIRVADFDQIALDCGYKEYEIQGLRKHLKDEGYIYTKEDRYAILVRLDKKPTRVIAFDPEKMKEAGVKVLN